MLLVAVLTRFLSSPQPPPLPDDDTRDMAEAVHRPPSLVATPYRYSPLEVARNGGIPTFVRERIEERQKKKSDMESSERLSDEVCVCVGGGGGGGGGRMTFDPPGGLCRGNGN